MNKKLCYNGKEAHEMTKEELQLQLEINKKRIKGNSLFTAIITGISLVSCAPVAIFVIAIGMIRRNQILENNKVLQGELSKR